MKINIGGSKGLKKFQKGWKVLDCAPGADFEHDLNSGKSFPISDLAVSYFYSSNTLEHVYLENQRFVFSEMYRCLEKNGKVRIVVPDFRYAAKLYVNNDIYLKSKRLPTTEPEAPPTLLGDLFGWINTKDRKHNRSGHHMIYDYETLEWYLNFHGFENIKQSSYDSTIDFGRYASWCLFVEAEKRA